MAVDDELYGRYSSALEKSCGLARRDVSRVVEASAGDLDALRDALLTSYPAIVEKYGDLAASSAMEFYEESRELAKAPGPYSPVMADADPRDALERNVRYSMGDYYGTGDKAALTSKLGDSAQRHVMNAAERTLVANAKRDRAHPRWALVPHAGACPYCMMLGSRGFAYKSKDTAMASRHDGCGCTPVVDFDRKSPKLKGYDPDALYREWHEAEMAKAQIIKSDIEGHDGYYIPPNKIIGYALKEENKAEAFELALGFTRQNADELTKLIIEECSKRAPEFEGGSRWGRKYSHSVVMEGANGKAAKVKICWIMDEGSNRMRLTTVFVDK